MERRVFPHLKEHSKVPPEENTVQKQHNTGSPVQEGLGCWIDSSENEFFHCDELSIDAQRDWQRKNLFSQAGLPIAGS